MLGNKGRSNVVACMHTHRRWADAQVGEHLLQEIGHNQTEDLVSDVLKPFVSAEYSIIIVSAAARQLRGRLTARYQGSDPQENPRKHGSDGQRSYGG